MDSRNRTLRYSVATLRCAAVLATSVPRALPLVLLDGKDAAVVRGCCALLFAPAATDGNGYGTISRCARALAWRMRLAAAGLAGRGATRTSGAPSAAVCSCSVYCTPGWVYVLVLVVGHEHTTTCVCMVLGCAALGLCAIAIGCVPGWSSRGAAAAPCLGMCLQPPLAGRASTPGLITKACRRSNLPMHDCRHYFFYCLRGVQACHG